MLNIPSVQQQISVFLAKELSSTLHTKITIGRVNLGVFNRLIIDNLQIDDQTGKELLKVTRASVKFNLFPLFKKKISITNAQLFGFNIRLQKNAPNAIPNYQFILDAFAPKDSIKKNNSLDLRINSLLIRRGRMSYNVLSTKETPEKFNPQHFNIKNFRADISLKVLQRDSINAAIKRLSLEEEQSGSKLKKLSLKILANNKKMRIENFAIELQNTSLKMDTIRMDYDSLSAFNHFADKIHFSFRILPSTITLHDLSAILPTFTPFKEPLEVELEAKGTINQLNCPILSISAKNHFRLKGNVSLQDLSHPEETFIFGHLSNLYADQEGIAFFVRNLSNKNNSIPPILQRLGTVSFHGEISGYFTELVTYGIIHTDIGTVRTDLKLKSDKNKGYFAYSGAIKTSDFELGKLIENPKLGKITLNLDIKGNQYNKQYPQVIIKGLIPSIDYSNYTYRNITLNAEYKQGGFSGKLALNDNNGSITLNGDINTTSKTPTFNFQANIRNVRPHDLHLTKNYKGAILSFFVKSNFTGASIDEMKGEIDVDSLTFTSPEKNYVLNTLKIRATQKDAQNKQLAIESNFLKANIEGRYSYRTLPASLFNIVKEYIPTLITSDKKTKETENDFHFNIHIFNTDILSTVFNIPINIYTHSTIDGYINDRTHKLRIEGYFPRLQYKDKFFESSMILCENPKDKMHVRLRFNNRKPEGSISVALEGNAKNDSIQTTLNWGNSSTATYSGKLSTIIHFMKEQELTTSPKERAKHDTTLLTTNISIQKTNIILNDTLWQVHPSEIRVDSGKVHINNFLFSHEDRHLAISGVISNQSKDTLRLDLKDLNIGYIFDIANLGVNFQGEATGSAYASSLLQKPVMFTNLYIKNLGINNGLLGNANIHGEWHHNVRGIYLDAQIKEKDIAQSHVYGYIYPLKPESGLDLQIEANKTNLKFLEYYMTSITPDFNGRASGHVHFYGKFKELTLQGRVLGDASMKVDVLNTTFSLKDSILIEPGGLTFQDNRIFDPQGNQGKVNGYLHYQHFKDMKYHFQFDYKHILMMNTQENPEFPFYGTVYGTGNALIQGNAQDGLNIDIAMATDRNTSFVYMKETVASAVNNQFIKFIDKTPRRAILDSVQLATNYELAQEEAQQEEKQTDIHLNLLVDATPDATMKIVMDPIAGDFISGKGSGNIRAEFFNKGDIKMFGNYQINQGTYKFSLQEVIRKDFTIRSGSTIAFNGPPLDATLNINALYPVNSVSLNDLMPNASEYVNQTNIKVNCTMNITGQLTSPDIKLGIEIPTERDEIQALIRNYIPTDEQMNMQILYLLSIGKFYTPENVSVTQNSNMMSSMLSSTISGQFNNALSHIIDNNNWNIGTNLSTGQKGWTDVEFEGMLSGQLLNNRLLINGNFGYKDNPLANTNFVGDFEAEWLINHSGDIRFKAYSETNDRYYSKSNLTTQGIGIIFKKDFSRWKELIFWNKWRLKKLKKRQQKESSEKIIKGNSSESPAAKAKREHQ